MQAKYGFDRDFWKLMCNSCFGKTMENLRNRVNIKFACSNSEDAASKGKSTITGTGTFPIIVFEKLQISFWAILLDIPKCWYFNMIWGIKGGIESSTRARELIKLSFWFPSDYRSLICRAGGWSRKQIVASSWSVVVRLLVARSRWVSRPGSGCFRRPKDFGWPIAF